MASVCVSVFKLLSMADSYCSFFMTWGVNSDLLFLGSHKVVGGGGCLRGCNVNHPVQGWVWPEINEAKTRLGKKSSRRSYQDGRGMKTGHGGRENKRSGLE